MKYIIEVANEYKDDADELMESNNEVWIKDFAGEPIPIIDMERVEL
jgi:hypothetical protein